MDRVDLIDMEKGLAYNCEVENRYLSEEIDKCLYKRDVLDMEFRRIIEEFNDHLEENAWLINACRTIYNKEISNNVVRLKEIIDRIEYYDMLIADYRRHIEHNNRLMKEV